VHGARLVSASPQLKAKVALRGIFGQRRRL
jgi:hypothetical protein